jgi:hypothetical protein
MLAVSVLAAAVGFGCAGATPAASPTGEEGFPQLRVASGPPAPERLRGDVFLEEIPLGSVEIQVCPKAGSDRFSMQSRIAPAALLRLVRRLGGRMLSLLSEEDYAPVQTQVDVFSGDATRSYRLLYRPGGFDYQYRRTAQAEPQLGTRQLPEPAPVNDMHSALLQLRAWRPRLEETAQFFVAIGRDLWRVDVRSRGPEMLQVQGAPALTHRIDGDARRIGAEAGSDPADTRRTFSLWLGEGPDALPTRLVASANYGNVSMSLESHDRSTDGCPAPEPLAR